MSADSTIASAALLAACSDREYLERTHTSFYIADALAQLAEHLQDHPKDNPVEFMSSYFNSVLSGENVTFRDYEYIQATPRNRRSFITLLFHTYRHLAASRDVLTLHDCHALITLLCHDFPADLIYRMARTEEASPPTMTFTDFLYAFQVEFYFMEFLSLVASSYAMLQVICDRTVGVAASTVLADLQKQLPALKAPTLPMDVLQAVLGSSSFPSSADLMNSLVRSETLSSLVHALPPRRGIAAGAAASEDSKGRRPRRASSLSSMPPPALPFPPGPPPP